MAKKPTSPIKVTATLVDGRLNSADGIIMLDSILYHAWFIKHAPHVLEGYGKERFNGHFGLPLLHLPGNRWAASRGIYTETGKTVENYNKRPNFFNSDKIRYLDMQKGLISESVGEYRAYRMPQVIRTVQDGKIEFWARGHKEEVQELLDLIPTVGKKYSMGYGIVKSWLVEDCPEDYSLWHPQYGLMRPVEVGSDEERMFDLSAYPVMDYAIKPPYWKESNFRLCYVPMNEGNL